MIDTILYCDPSRNNELKLQFGEQIIILERPHANAILAAIWRLTQGQCSGIALINQASSFTLIRVVVAISNALAYSKGVKLYQVTNWSDPLSQPVSHLTPHYSAEPTITHASGS